MPASCRSLGSCKPIHTKPDRCRRTSSCASCQVGLPATRLPSRYTAQSTMAVLRSTSGIQGTRALRPWRSTPGRENRGRGTVAIGTHSPPSRGRSRQDAIKRASGPVRGSANVQFGRYYEEFEVGAVYKHWPGKTVTEYDDHLFCLLTMNHHPLHLDANYAENTTDFGRNVVVGNYVYSLVLGMSVPDVSGKAIANLEVESLKHAKPTFHGDTIYARTTVLDKTPSRSKSDRGVVQVETVGYNQDGTVVCLFRRKVMVPTREYIDARGGEQPGRPEP